MPPRPYDFLRALEVFVAVAKKGSMTGAAKHLGMTQSAVSQHIQQLEGSLECLLIDRDLRPLRLTPPGDLLRQRGEQLLTDAEEIKSAVRLAASVPLPTLKMAVLGSLNAIFQPLLLPLLQSRLSLRNISVITGLGTDHQLSLLNRDVDLIITADAQYESGGLEHHELLREPHIIAVPPGYDGPTDSLKSLAENLPLIRYGTRAPIGRRIEQQLRRMQLQIPPHMDFDAPNAVLSMVAAGHGWAITCPLHTLILFDELRCHPFPGPTFYRTTTLVARNGELGKIPRELAALARQTMKDELLPRLYRGAPWLAPEMEID